MPFRHIVLLTLDDGCELDALVEEIRSMAADMATVRSYVVGHDAGLGEGNATVGIVADFDDEAGWAAYRDDPAHRQLIAERITPFLLARTALQHET